MYLFHGTFIYLSCFVYFVILKGKRGMREGPLKKDKNKERGQRNGDKRTACPQDML